MQPNIVLLAGGKGKRLWPLSDHNRSKQFITLPDVNISSFQLAIKRSLNITPAKNIVIITNLGYQDLVFQQIKDLNLNIDDFNIIFNSITIILGLQLIFAVDFLCKIIMIN